MKMKKLQEWIERLQEWRRMKTKKKLKLEKPRATNKVKPKKPMKKLKHKKLKATKKKRGQSQMLLVQ